MTLPPRLSGALELCRAGRFADAERELRALLSGSPRDADVLQLLGIVASSLGRVEESLVWFDRAGAVRPGSLALTQNRAQSLFKLGRLAEARAEAQSIARADPSNAQARDLLARIVHEEGVAHHAAGRFEEAIEAYRRAIGAGLVLPQAHANLGNALKMAGRDDEALAQFAEALRLDPDSAMSLANYGTALADAGGAAAAIPLLERAVAADPASERACTSLGGAYYAVGRYDDSVAELRRAIAIRPESPQALNSLGNSLLALGRVDEAVRTFRGILARDPNEETALANLGALLQGQGDIEGARECYETALRANPHSSPALNSLGLLLRDEGRVDEAAALFERGLAVQPRSARAAYNLALARLYQHRFADGWRLHEARLRATPPVTVRREFPVPLLAAAEIGRGHRVAIWREQGVGDQILYSTALADLEARGQEFVLEIDARLVPAVRRAHPGWSVVAPEESGAAFAGCDRHAPMADVAGFLRPTPASFSAQPRSFLAADPARAALYRERLAQPGRRVVGISWRSFQPGARASVGGRKSAPLEAFVRLADRADLRLLDLQYGDTSAERARFPGELARLEDLDLFGDLDGVLAAIEACDVVVTTSSVTAHLAGAAGKETLLIYLGAAPPFHYWVPGEDGRALWYPSVRIVTGRDIDTWPRAIERVDELLGR